MKITFIILFVLMSCMQINHSKSPEELVEKINQSEIDNERIVMLNLAKILTEKIEVGTRRILPLNPHHKIDIPRITNVVEQNKYINVRRFSKDYLVYDISRNKILGDRIKDFAKIAEADIIAIHKDFIGTITSEKLNDFNLIEAKRNKSSIKRNANSVSDDSFNRELKSHLQSMEKRKIDFLERKSHGKKIEKNPKIIDDKKIKSCGLGLTGCSDSIYAVVFVHNLIRHPKITLLTSAVTLTVAASFTGIAASIHNKKQAKIRDAAVYRNYFKDTEVHAISVSRHSGEWDFKSKAKFTLNGSLMSTEGTSTALHYKINEELYVSES